MRKKNSFYFIKFKVCRAILCYNNFDGRFRFRFLVKKYIYNSRQRIRGMISDISNLQYLPINKIRLLYLTKNEYFYKKK